MCGARLLWPGAAIRKQPPSSKKSSITAVIEDFLELGGCFRIAAPGHKSLAPHIGRVETTQIQIALRPFRPIRTEERFAIARCYDVSDSLVVGSFEMQNYPLPTFSTKGTSLPCHTTRHPTRRNRQ